MKKLLLELEDLSVESFDTLPGRGRWGDGTVFGHTGQPSCHDFGCWSQANPTCLGGGCQTNEATCNTIEPGTACSNDLCTAEPQCGGLDSENGTCDMTCGESCWDNNCNEESQLGTCFEEACMN